MECTKKPGEKRFLRYFSYILLLALLVGTYSLVLSEIDGETLLHSLDNAHLGVLLIGFLFVLGYIFFEGCAIRTLCGSFGVKFGYFTAFRYACVELYFSAVTPSSSGGQPLMAYYMCREGVPVCTSSLAVIINTIAYAMVTLVFALCSIFFMSDAVFSMSALYVIAVVLGCVVCVLLVLGCLLCLYWEGPVRKAAYGILRFLAFLRIVRKVDKKMNSLETFLTDLRAGAEHTRRAPGAFLRALGENALQRLCYLMVSYCVYRSFGLHEASVVTILLLQMVMTIPAYSIPLPGGVGITELMFFDLYATIYLVETELPAAMILTRGLNHYLCILLCGFVTVGTHIYSGRKAARLQAAKAAESAEISQEVELTSVK